MIPGDVGNGTVGVISPVGIIHRLGGRSAIRIRSGGYLPNSSEGDGGILPGNGPIEGGAETRAGGILEKFGGCNNPIAGTIEQAPMPAHAAIFTPIGI